VHLAKHAFGLVGRCGHGRAVSDIEADRMHLLRLVPPFEDGKGLVDVILPQIREYDLHPRLDEGAGDTEPDSTRSTGYERHLANNVLHSATPGS
jgi:hypothetical protein